MTEAEQEARDLAEWDWVYTTTPGGLRLHHLARMDDPEVFNIEVRGPGATTCGLVGEFRIPGMFDRMGMPRCVKCCDRLGIARGIGSPKNDPDLRPWVEARLATAPPRSASVAVGETPKPGGEG